MRYPKTHVRSALAAAREAGKSMEGLNSGLRETELTLERWGFLPLPGDKTVDDRMAAWYKAQGLAVAADAQPPQVTAPTLARVAVPSDAALDAAEAALVAAQAALALARSLRSA